MTILMAISLRKWLNARYLLAKYIELTYVCLLTCWCSFFQVDQLVLEDLVRERFQKLGICRLTFYLNITTSIHLCHVVIFVRFFLIFFFYVVNHLDYLGVQIAWVAGPWFLSIFMNMLPWESGQLLYYNIRVILLEAYEKLNSLIIMFFLYWHMEFIRHLIVLISSSPYMGCAFVWWKSCDALPNGTCFNGVIW